MEDGKADLDCTCMWCLFDITFGGPTLLYFAKHKATLNEGGDNRISAPSKPISGNLLLGT